MLLSTFEPTWKEWKRQTFLDNLSEKELYLCQEVILLRPGPSWTSSLLPFLS